MSNFIHDILKIQFIAEGYLPDQPYHLISDSELMDAFFHTKSDDNDDLDTSYVDPIDFFHQVYYLPDNWYELSEQYQKIVNAIQLIVYTWKNLQSAAVSSQIVSVDNISYTVQKETLPNWIYSYMFKRVVSPASEIIDIHDLLVLLDADNMNDDFTAAAGGKCYTISQQWLQKYPQLDKRPATVFGEPHVIKSLRLQQQGDT